MPSKLMARQWPRMAMASLPIHLLVLSRELMGMGEWMIITSEFWIIPSFPTKHQQGKQSTCFPMNATFGATRSWETWHKAQVACGR